MYLSTPSYICELFMIRTLGTSPALHIQLPVYISFSYGYLPLKPNTLEYIIFIYKIHFILMFYCLLFILRELTNCNF